MGRLELLTWLNDITEIDYPKVENCADGIGYCQILDALHPGIVQLSKLNFSARSEGDFSRNLKVLDDALVKLSLEKLQAVDKLAKAKFQENIQFLQWLYTYATKFGLVNGSGYPAYERRLDAMKKQKIKGNTMNSYLIPNKAFLKLRKQQEFINQQKQIAVQYNMNQNMEDIGDTEEHEEENEQLSDRYLVLNEVIKELEVDIKKRMEYNWKFLFNLEEVSKERDFFFNLLSRIEEIADESPESEVKASVMDILKFAPEDFDGM